MKISYREGSAQSNKKVCTSLLYLEHKLKIIRSGALLVLH